MTNRNINPLTLSDYMSDIKNNLRIDTFRIKQMSDALITDVLPQYLETVEVLFTDTEAEKYKYNPKGLSHTLYGTVDLWFLICNINGFKRPFEFNTGSSIKLPTSSSIRKLENCFATYGVSK